SQSPPFSTALISGCHCRPFSWRYCLSDSSHLEESTKLSSTSGAGCLHRHLGKNTLLKGRRIAIRLFDSGNWGSSRLFRARCLGDECSGIEKPGGCPGNSTTNLACL